MANAYIKQVSGGQKSSPANTDAIELDDGSTSTYAVLSDLFQAAWNYLTSLTAKTTLADADQLGLADSAASNVGKKITWANVMVQILAYTGTVTNKRIQKRAVTVTQAATPTTNTDNGDIFNITALAQAITSMTTNLSGTPVDGEMILFQITDDGTARAITWGASFASTTGTTLPTTTVLGKRLRVLLQWNSATSDWECLATTSGV